MKKKLDSKALPMYSKGSAFGLQNAFQTGRTGRNRPAIAAGAAKTGRNQKIKNIA